MGAVRAGLRRTDRRTPAARPRARHRAPLGPARRPFQSTDPITTTTARPFPGSAPGWGPRWCTRRWRGCVPRPRRGPP
ncbi:hypothetical protein ACFFX0_01270 [Citricoccus parietis]|uniref:Uncharacterized protein n=1 Tax=Citricoccus parietis TaxID=592307 RepID=A0ABV5FTA1_9MICC